MSYIALRVKEYSFRGIGQKQLRKIVLYNTVGNTGGQQVFVLMTQGQIPAVLRKDKGIACFVGVLIDDKYKRVQHLERRAINAATGAQRKPIRGVGLVADVAAWEKAAVIARKG